LSNDDKKDLTRIEDLGEFLHELNNENESYEVEAETHNISGLPDIPSDSFEEDPPAFGEETSFETSEELTTTDEDPFSVPESTEEEAGESLFGESSETDFGSDFSSATEESSFESVEPAWGENTEDSPFETSSFEENTEPAQEEEINFLAEETPEEVELEIEEETSFDSDPTPEPVQEEVTSFYDSGTREDFKEHKTENFDDVKKFAENSTYSSTTAEANPSFSILIKNVRFTEDASDIAHLLNELKIMTNIDETKKSLNRGSLLVPRISEFAAVFISHKLRRFDADVLVGLSDDIHPPKNGADSEVGLVSKQHLYQNHAHSFDFSRPKVDLGSVIISTSPQLDQYQILRYLGVASEHAILDSAVVEDETSSKIQFHYEELAHKLKAHAVKLNANAVIGINYHLTPLPSEFSMGPARYKLACTGNLVWVNRL